jgi:hypothetical protein
LWKSLAIVPGGNGLRPAVVALAGFIEAGTVWIVLDVICHHEIEPAVAVVIDEGGGDGPEGIIEAGFSGGEFAEGAIAAIHEEPHGAVLGDEDIGPAVVVHIADCDAHSAPGDVEPGVRRSHR